MSKVLYSKKEKVAYITLNRPKVNVVDMEMVAELEMTRVCGWPF